MLGAMVMIIVMVMVMVMGSHGVPRNKSGLKLSEVVNRDGPYLGVVMAEQSELDPLLLPSIFHPHSSIPFIDLAGRRFHIGVIEGHKVIAVRSGDGMLNAGMTSQALLDFFDVSGVLHYGTSGCLNYSLGIGYVHIPQYLVHAGVWKWQRLGEGPDHSNGFVSDADLGNLHFGDHNVPIGKRTNKLNNALLLPEEVYSVKGTPETAQNVFWVPVNSYFYDIASKLQGIELEYCVNSTKCLDERPSVVIGLRAASASTFIDNAAYREFLFNNYGISSNDMESAGVSLACLANDVPFISIQGLSDLAGGSSTPNEYHTFDSLASKNAVKVVQEFIKNLHNESLKDSTYESILLNRSQYE